MARYIAQIEEDTLMVLRWFMERACVPVTEAAKRMGVSVSAAKRAAQEHGIVHLSRGRTFLGVDGILRRTCSWCEQTKTMDKFPKERKNPQGRGHACRICRAKYDAAKVSATMHLARSQGVSMATAEALMEEGAE